MKARRVKKLDPAAPLDLNAARILAVRLAELHGFAEAALAGDADAQHDMRIAAKRVRYALEATGFAFGAPAERARKAAKRLQEVLGELHDCDVLAPLVAEHSAELERADAEHLSSLAGGAKDLDPALAAEAPHRTAYRGLGVLGAHVRGRRLVLFERFSELWEELEREGVWEALAEAVELRRARG